MISLRIIISSLVLFVLMAQVSAFWGGSGFFGQQNPRFRSSYYSPNLGYGMSSYSPTSSWTRYQHYGRGFGGGGYYSDDYMDDLYDRNSYGRGWM